MSGDLVERLRTWSAMGISQSGSNILKEAADEIERLRAALREAAMIAEDGCLVPPDGGSPTEDERLMCRNIAVRILALMGAKDE